MLLFAVLGNMCMGFGLAPENDKPDIVIVDELCTEVSVDTPALFVEVNAVFEPDDNRGLALVFNVSYLFNSAVKVNVNAYKEPDKEGFNAVVI